MDKIIVTIGREFGTGGRQIAMLLSEMLNIKVYDRKLLEELKKQYNLTTEEMDKIKAHKKNWWDDFTRFYQQASTWANRPYYEAVYVPEVTSELLFQEEKRILLALAEKESCIILGRTGFHIFKDYPNAFKVFLTADMPFRRDKVGRRLNITDGKADLLIKRIDEDRENFTQSFSSKSRYDARNYDLVVNVTDLEPESVARFIADCIERRLQQRKH